MIVRDNFSYFSLKPYVVSPHLNRLIETVETVQMRCHNIFLCRINKNKASQAIQSPRTVPFFLLVSLLDRYSFPNVLVKGIVAFKQ